MHEDKIARDTFARGTKLHDDDFAPRVNFRTKVKKNKKIKIKIKDKSIKNKRKKKVTDRG